MIEHPLSSGRDEQLELEQEALDTKVSKWMERNARLESKGLNTMTDAGGRLLRLSVEPLKNAIEKFLESATERAGRKHIAYHAVSQLDPATAAFITARVIYDGITTDSAYQTVATKIGNRLEDEVRFAKFEEENRPLYNKVQQNLDNHFMGYNPQVRRSTLKHATKKFGIGFEEWSKTDRLQAGSKLMDLFIESVGLVRRVKRTNRKGIIYCLEATEKLTELLADINNTRCSILAPYFMPMVCPPEEWTSPRGGGYLSDRGKYDLVKNRDRGYQDELRKCDGMERVYEAVNKLQGTAWKINSGMLTVVREIWDAGLDLKGFPAREDMPIPPRPGDYETNKDAKIAWKQHAKTIFHENRKAQSKRLQTAKVMYLAGKFEASPAIWFPQVLDFRGRAYSVPLFLNPQGSDLAKSLLTFAEGKALGERGVYWLGVHLSNTYGNDKVGLDDRHTWARENSGRIEACANDPIANRWWMEADKPFQFLAACIEWLGYLHDGGENYVSSLPIMVDGSCNGLQHFSAMTRDEIAGRQVNLIPQDKPADIYSAVAEAVVNRLDSEAHTSPFAAAWSNFDIDRKMCKRPVMVLPYGGTREAVRTYLLTEVTERIANGRQNPFGLDLNKAIQYLTTVVWNVMGEVIVGPRKVMDWLREVARVTNGLNMHIFWNTPSGFRVQQAYLKSRLKRVKTKTGEEFVYFSLREELKGKHDRRRQVQAISPNFVHSLDASALMLTILGASGKGVGSFSAVHDSYGTLAADLQVLLDTLREEFVRMYEDHDVLADFIQDAVPEGVEIPERPKMGNLDLQGVRQSDFFFA